LKGRIKGLYYLIQGALPPRTTLLEASTYSEARVRFYNGSWIDLSGQNADITKALLIQPSASQVTEDGNTKSIIGSNSSVADGVLILQPQTRAMVLPTAQNTNDIVNPSPGMLVYINKT